MRRWIDMVWRYATVCNVDPRLRGDDGLVWAEGV